MKTLFEKQYTKEVIVTWIAPEQPKLWKYWASTTEEGVVSLYDLSSHRA